MIPTHWFRRLILFLFIMEVGGGMLWVASWVAPTKENAQSFQTVASLIFLFWYYSGTPLMARFLAPFTCKEASRQEMVMSLQKSIPESRPVFLYEHADKEANTVGLFPYQSRIYLTTGLLDNMSQQGLLGILGHENAHVRGLHVLISFCYACIFALGSYLSNSTLFFLAGFFLFLMLRRYLEYCADEGSAKLVGRDAMQTGLQELARLYPAKKCMRFFNFLMAYPTLAMRLKALETGRKVLL